MGAPRPARRPDFDLVKKYSDRWYNYDSADTDLTPVNFITLIGRRWNRGPEGFATKHLEVNLDHVAICEEHCTP